MNFCFQLGVKLPFLPGDLVNSSGQVKQVLSLRDKLLLRSTFSCWCNRSQLRRLVLCGRAISEVRRWDGIAI